MLRLTHPSNGQLIANSPSKTSGVTFQEHLNRATSIAARKIRRRFDEAKDPCTADGENATLNRFVGEVTRDYRQEQAVYDQETKHGVFLFGQGKWESRVNAALNE